MRYSGPLNTEGSFSLPAALACNRTELVDAASMVQGDSVHPRCRHQGSMKTADEEEDQGHANNAQTRGLLSTCSR